MKQHHRLSLLALLGAVALPLVHAADATPAPDIWGVVAPAWLTEASFTVKGGYDTNVFGVSTNLAGHPDIANQEAWVATASPKLTVNALPLLGIGATDAIKAFSFGYSGEYSLYDGISSENNAKHTLSLQLKTQEGAWSFGFDNSFLYVDGSNKDPFFSTYSAYSTAIPRERRHQIQERPTASLRYDLDQAFLRAVGSAAYYNLLVDRYDPVGANKGYINYVNRSDANAGLDLGWKASSDCSYFLGWRVGQQIQGRQPWGGTHCNSTYNRLLLGFEGKLFPWLSGNALVGPDYRRYADASNLGLAGQDHTWLYAEGNLTATLSPEDSLVATTKVWHWVSSTGSTSYQDSTYTLAYKHAFNKQLSVAPGIRFLASKYDYPTVRDDQLWAFTFDVTYVVTKEISISADYLSQNDHSRIPEAIGPGRGFDESLVSLSVKFSL
jgi:hypothetical protein